MAVGGEVVVVVDRPARAKIAAAKGGAAAKKLDLRARVWPACTMRIGEDREGDGVVGDFLFMLHICLRYEKKLKCPKC